MTDALPKIGDDYQLLVKARDGDRQALDALLRRHEQRVFRFGLRMCNDEEAAKEVLQRTLLTAFERLGEFRGDARMSTWLYSIARSFCSRLHRPTRSAPIHDVPLDAPEGARPDLVDEEPVPAESAEREELSRLVAAAIAVLPEDYKEAVVLRDVEGLSAEEAAEITGIGVRAHKSRLHRGRQLLKAHLATLLQEDAGDERGAARACPRLAERLEQLGKEEVDRTACEEIEAHLADCPACAETLGALRATASLCRRLPGGDVPPAVQRAVRVALLRAIGS
jgi:RNA polymerase sigma-70 factor (ECF subfamily)